MNKKEKVWVVSYYDKGSSPVVTVFDNERAADQCFHYFTDHGDHAKIDIDECPVFQSFTVNGKEGEFYRE